MSHKSLKIGITGCVGFIGFTLARMLVERGYEVVGIDNKDGLVYPVQLKERRLEVLKQFSNFTFIEGDLNDPKSLQEVISHKPEVIVHLAARAGVRHSIKFPELYYHSNVNATLNLLNEMVNYGITNVIMAGTSSVYAGFPPPFKEDMSADRPLSPYAASKRAAELLLHSYTYLYGLKGLILRYFTVYGPFGRPDMLIYRLIYNQFQGQVTTIFGDGTQSRSFTYVDDAAMGTLRAIEWLAEQPEGTYDIINIGNPESFTLKELFSLLDNKDGLPLKLTYTNFIPADIKATTADISKAKRILGWQPTTSLPEGIDKTWEWFKTNWEWIRNIPLP